MKKILIVDDEEKICWLIESYIQWDVLKAEKAAVAHNGEEALQLIEEFRPDIVLTDIRMPDMDGLELVQKGKQLYSDIVFVIVSGYSQFEYAQSALRYGVYDFLLKPVNANELNETLKKICSDIDRRNVQKEEYIKNQIEIQEQHTQVQKAVIKILTGEAASTDFNRFLDDAPEIGFWKCLVLHVNQNLNNCTIMEENFFHSQLTDIVNEFLMQYVTFSRVFNIRGYLIAFVKGDTVEGLSQIDWKKFAEEIKSNLEKYDYNDISMGISNAVESSGDLSEILLQAFKAWGRKFIFREKTILDWGSVLVKSDDVFREEEVERYLSDYKSACTELNEDKVSEKFTFIFYIISSFFSDNYHIKALSLIDKCIVYYQKQLIAMNYISEEELQKDVEQLYLLFRNATNIKELHVHMSNYLTSRIVFYKSKRDERDSQPVLLAKQYIEEHLDTERSLQDAADYAGISLAYLSVLFRNETGINFKDYVLERKMEKARQMLRDTNEKISTIAAELGYKDSKYFSRLFEKHVGLKPIQFRRLMR